MELNNKSHYYPLFFVTENFEDVEALRAYIIDRQYHTTLENNVSYFKNVNMNNWSDYREIPLGDIEFIKIIDITQGIEANILSKRWWDICNGGYNRTQTINENKCIILAIGRFDNSKSGTMWVKRTIEKCKTLGLPAVPNSGWNVSTVKRYFLDQDETTNDSIINTLVKLGGNK
jgi:hypothetical protein